MRVVSIVGARPQFVKAAVLSRALRENHQEYIIHTGQHYSPNMDGQIFEDLELPYPQHHLQNVSKKKMHGAQTAAMLEGVEKILVEKKPSIVLVGGDANTNLAGALAARKLHIKVGHVEAGERSFDWRMPEEHNRRIIDHISELLFTTNKKGMKNLQEEKVMGKIFFVRLAWKYRFTSPV